MSTRSTDVTRPVSPVPQVRFDPKENDRLTSFSGLVIFQSLFRRLKLREKLKACFEHLASERLYQPHVIVLAQVPQLAWKIAIFGDSLGQELTQPVCSWLRVRRFHAVL